MKLKLILPTLLVGIMMLISCKKEAAIQPDTLQPEYTLPQGNHDYDTRIVNFQHKYGTYILYKFTDKDFRWNINAQISYVADQGDQNNITPALNALDEYLLHYYNDDFLKKTLPYKIMLSARIRQVVYDPWASVVTLDTLDTPVASASAFSHIAFGYANDQLANMSADELKQMKTALHTEFWKQAINTKKVKFSPVFVEATPDYTLVGSWNVKNYGVLGEPGVNSTYTPSSDFTAYIQLIASTTQEELEKTLFLPGNDPNGKYRLKYNAIINYYKLEYNINLQALAN
jgi:hypothetical protein